MTQPRVIQAAAWYPPHNLGGTEIFLSGLVAELSGIGIESTILVPRDAVASEAYRHMATNVETYPVNEVPVAGEMRDGHPHCDFDVFLSRLSQHRSAIYHQHSWTRGCGPNHLRAARELGMRTVLTVHVPGNTCLRGTMRRFGRAPCDGRVEETLCGACWAEARGMPQLAAQTIANIPLPVAMRARVATGRFATALSARALGAERLRDIAGMIANADRVVAVCQWLYNVLGVNGVPADKLVLSRQGVFRDDLVPLRATAAARSVNRGPLRLLFLGRWDPAKGVDVLVRAMRALPANMAVRLTIRAISAPAREREYEERVGALARGDPRISIKGPVSRDGLAATLADYDALVVPSLGLETGPLVVLEARAAGLFVLGSRLGGIAELVDESDAGELIEAGNVNAWVEAIQRLAFRQSQGGLPRPSRPVRTMATVAAEMADLYHSL